MARPNAKGDVRVVYTPAFPLLPQDGRQAEDEAGLSVAALPVRRLGLGPLGAGLILGVGLRLVAGDPSDGPAGRGIRAAAPLESCFMCPGRESARLARSEWSSAPLPWS